MQPSSSSPSSVIVPASAMHEATPPDMAETEAFARRLAACRDPGVVAETVFDICLCAMSELIAKGCDSGQINVALDNQRPTQPSTPRSESVAAEHSGEEPAIAPVNGQQPTQPSADRRDSVAAEEMDTSGGDSNTRSDETTVLESSTEQMGPSLLPSVEETRLASVQQLTRPPNPYCESVPDDAMDTSGGNNGTSDETVVLESAAGQTDLTIGSGDTVDPEDTTLPDAPAVTAGELNGAGETTPVGDEPADDVDGHGTGSCSENDLDLDQTLVHNGVRNEKRDGLLHLLPTDEQCGNIPQLYQIAAEMGAAQDGAFKIIVPKQTHTFYSLSEPDREREFPAYQFSFRPIYPKTIGLNRTGTEEQLRFEHEREASTAPTDELVRQFEELKAKNVRDIRYFSDLDAQNAKYRDSIGFPSTSPIFPLPGTRLDETRERIKGVHWPYAYISADPFGAPFALHIEDGWLSSVNYLYAGEKIWFIIPSDQREILETQVSKMAGVTNSCSQFLRHFARYIKRSTLDKWGVRYTVVRQLPGEVIMTFPKVYHQGFSTGSTVAEAINYAGEDWSMDGYRFCSPSCPEGSIMEDKLALRREDEPQEGPDIDDHSSDEAEDELEDNEDEPEEDEDEPEEDKDESEEDEPDGKNPKKRGKKQPDKGPAPKKPKAQPPKSKPKSIAAVEAAKKGQLTKLRNSVGLANARLPPDFIPLDAINESLPSPTKADHRHTILRLVCQIGSPQAISDLRDGWAAQRMTTTTAPTHPLVALDDINEELYKLYIRRHYHLADLAKRYSDEYERNKTNKALTSRVRGVKVPPIDTAPRIDTAAREKLLGDAYPDVPKDSLRYNKLNDAITPRLSKGRKWAKLVAAFGNGILGLIPNDVTDTDFENLEVREVDFLVMCLRKYRGGFLGPVSEIIGRFLPELIDGRVHGYRFLFEREGVDVLQEEFDDPRLLELCGVRDD